MTGQLSLFRVAPDTPPGMISRNAPYHAVGPDTVSNADHSAGEVCRRCKEIANPAHVTDAGKDRSSLAVWCGAHCPTCREWAA